MNYQFDGTKIFRALGFKTLGTKKNGPQETVSISKNLFQKYFEFIDWFLNDTKLSFCWQTLWLHEGGAPYLKKTKTVIRFIFKYLWAWSYKFCSVMIDTSKFNRRLWHLKKNELFLYCMWIIPNVNWCVFLLIYIHFTLEFPSSLKIRTPKFFIRRTLNVSQKSCFLQYNRAWKKSNWSIKKKN